MLNQSVCFDRSSVHEVRSGRSLSSGSGFDFHQEEQLSTDDRIHLEDGWIGFHEPR